MKEDRDLGKKALVLRRSDPNVIDSIVAGELPWGSLKLVPASSVDYTVPPGHFAVKSLLQELFSVFDRKINFVEDSDGERNVSRTIQLVDDSYVENLLRVLNTLCEHCLPSVLSTLIHWYERWLKSFKEISEKTTKSDEQRLTINYLFCTVLIEILPQLHFFPTVCENSVSYIVALAFEEVAYCEPSVYGPNYNNYLLVAERYAEVLGVLSQTHAVLIQQKFLSILDELRKENPMTPFGMNCIIALLMAMKCYRIKTSDVDEFEVGIRFLNELGQYYLDIKQKDIKHAVAGLLVEILLPVAAQIKTEANIPAVISFVDKLYAPTLELVNKKRDKMAAYPLLTCLLCISQSKFFLMNWAQFLNSTLASLKNKDPKVSRIALESLYRLLWVYVIRNNCEGNTATRNRLESICNSLFPKGNRAVVPRDAPLNIFVKIIHFIAQQKLDFAFKEIIFDLLGCNRAHSLLKSSIYPERMNIGVRALMVIANSLQQKEGPPDMPPSITVSSSQRLKKTYISRPLTPEIARSIGIELYYSPCRRAFDAILRALDSQVGKPLMMTAAHTRGKEPEELLTGDVKPKLDLYRTCIAAIPRLLPDSMAHSELVELLVRMNVHIDEELQVHAAQTLQTLMSECAEWREDIIHSFLNYMTHQFSDTYPLLLDSFLRLLYQLLFTWKTAANMEKKREVDGNFDRDSSFSNPLRMQISPMLTNSVAIALHAVEGFALAMMCQHRTQSRKLAINILKEVRHLLTLVTSQQHDTPVIEVLDNATSYVVNKYIEHVPLCERQSWNHDFSSASDKIASIETDSCLVNSDKGNEYFRWDAWASALSGYCEHRFLLTQCPTAVFYAWPVVQIRLNACANFVDPNNPQNENRASLLRTSKSKATASPLCGESLDQDSYLSLWQKYLVMACALTPPHNDYGTSYSRGFSPTSSIDNDVFRSLASSVRAPRTSAVINATFFQKAVAMLRWEHMTDMRDSVVLGVGSTNPVAFEALLDEMKGILREVMDRKTDNNARRKKRKDLLRLQIIRILQVSVFRGVLQCSGCIDVESGLCSVLVEFFDSMRQSLESDQDRDVLLLTNLRLHFAKTVAMIINSIAPDKRRNLLGNNLKQNLFFLFTSWCSRSIASSDKRRDGDIGTYVEQRAVEAMCALLCCGPIFEPIKAIGEDGYLYGWLEALLDSNNPVLEKLVESTLCTMLDLNDETSQLLEWTINVCYSKPPFVAAKSFHSLVMLFSRREYPCEFDSLFVLCQMLIADSDTRVSEPAVELLHLLRRQFLDDSLTVPNLTNFCNFSSSQIEICRLLAKTYPKITMSVFSEVCFRVENGKCNRRIAILSLLTAWLENIQFVDPHVNHESNMKDSGGMKAGWGSAEATQLILNNLLYITVILSAEHTKEISLLWNALATSHPGNLRIIVNYLFVMVSLSPDILLPHTKRVCCMLMESSAYNLLKILMDHMDYVNEQFKPDLERCEMPPFYRLQKNVGAGDEKRSDSDLSNSKEESDTSVVELVPISPVKITAVEDTTSLIQDLPMPAYGGHYSMLSSFLPPTTQPVLLFTRSNLSLLHISDLLRCTSSIQWCDYLPLLLHIAVLGLDSLRPPICHHARQTIINIVLLHAGEMVSASQISNILLNNQINIVDQVATISSTDDSRTDIPRGDTPTFSRMKCIEYEQMLLNSNSSFSASDLVQAIICCLSEKMDKPVWANEDVTPRQWRIESALQLGNMVNHLTELLVETIPGLATTWFQLAMGMALSISNRHIAGRCFQISSALCQSLAPWIPNILSRLAETVCEQHEDTQSYVTDIMLCLQTAASHLTMMSQPSKISQSPTHARSTSYTPAVLRQTANVAAAPLSTREYARHSVLVCGDREILSGLSRSKSTTALKSEDMVVGEEDFSTLSRLLLIAVAMLESNSDNEYLLALHLLDKIFDATTFDKSLCLQRLSKTVSQLDWKNFNGIIGLIMKGTTIQASYELSLSLLLKCLEVIDEPAMGPCSLISLLITSSMPLLMLNFEIPTSLCVSITKKLNEFLSERITETEEQSLDNPLSHLSAMMYKYAERCFPRDRFQWAKCVFKYMHDGLVQDHTLPFILLAEMLERSVASMHPYILHCIYLLAGTGDISQCSPLSLNAQVIRVVSKHVQGPNWKEASKILKAFVHYDSIAIDGHISDEPEADEVARPEGLQLEVPLRGVLSSVAHRSIPETSSLRKQTKVKERLISLLNASGLRIGLPKSTSIIFSQSLHDVSCKPTNSNSTSTEKISLSHAGDVESASSLVADPSVTDSFPRVFREFDFLETEHDTLSESTESCFNWLSTMRPRSISKVDIDVEEQYQDDECTEIVENLRPSSAASDSLEVSSERTPLQSGARSETVSEDESCDEELEEDEFVVDDEKLRVADVSSLAESIRCSHSAVSEKSPAAPLLPLFLQCIHHASAQGEHQWLSSFMDMSADETGNLTAHVTLLFSQLYRECCLKLSVILRDASQVLSLSHRDISAQFSDALDLVLKISDCPFLFVTAQHLRISETLSEQKCVLLELHEHYETFVERKEQCIRALNAIKATMKLALIGGSSSSVSSNQYLELCRSVHKLFFQLLLITDKFDSMIKGIANASDVKDTDMSSEVLCLHRCLLASIPDSVHNMEKSISSVTLESNMDTLLVLLQKKQYKNALHILRQLRQQFGSEYGCCDQVDVEVLLLAYCRSHQGSCWAVIGSDQALTHSCNQLRQSNMLMAAIVRSLAPEALNARSSRVSSASESYKS